MEEKTPQCIGIIPDGSRRWAKERGLPTHRGHAEGLDRLVDTVRWVRDRGIQHMAVYAFSTENWKRGEKEVSYLMALVKEATQKHLKKLSKEGVRLRFIGERDSFDPTLREAIRVSEKESEKNTALTLWVCFSYGGRSEIVSAARLLCERGEDITEESLRQNMWTAEMPDPDLIIRTSGEGRLSNFLLWQAAYSELFFEDAYWPDFSEATLDAILNMYAHRERRHGK
jgi:undecaprenyl diphosphate synthase